MISSTANPTVKRLCLLHERRGRIEQGLFLVEGVRLVEEALDSALAPATIMIAPDLLRATARGRALSDRLRRRRGAPEPFEVTPAVLKRVAATETPSGVVAALPRSPISAPGAVRRATGLLLVLDGIADPGNAGTILRTAAAAGVDAVVALAGSSDLYAPKVVRAAMGAHLRLALAVDIDPAALPAWLSPYEQTVLADARAAESLYDADLRVATALIVGGEAHGAAGAIGLPGLRPVAIPMPGATESLNVAVATAVILFEALRQRTRR